MEQIAEIMKSLGRIEQKVDNHLRSHREAESRTRWALGFSLTAISIAVTIAIAILAAPARGGVPVNYDDGDGAVRVFSSPGQWDGHDFVLTMSLDNGHIPNTTAMTAFFADSLGGTLDINVSTVYADTAATPAGVGAFVPAAVLEIYRGQGHNVSTQGVHKPRWNDPGEPWSHGYASWTDTDSMIIDMSPDSLGVRLGTDGANIGLSYPYGYQVGNNYKIAQDLGYEYARTYRESDWGFIADGWPSGYPDTPWKWTVDIGSDVVNLYAIGGNDSSSYCFGEGDSLTYAQVIARVEEVMVQPAVADGSYHLSLVLHGEPYLHRVKWILNYLDETYDVWFTDSRSLFEWWGPRNALYPRRPPAVAKGSILAATTADDSVYWAKTPEPSVVNGYVFQDGTTATLDTLDVGGHQFPATDCEYMEVRANAPTTTYPSGDYCTFLVGQFPLEVSDRIAALYFDCAETLAGKTIAKAELHWRCNYAPASLTLGPSNNGREYLMVTAVTDEDFAEWPQYGSAAASFTNVQQSTATAWATALSSYAAPESLGVVSYQWDTWTANTWNITDVTHGVQAWADGEPEGGFMFWGYVRGSVQVFTVEHHGHSTTSKRPYLVVYTED